MKRSGSAMLQAMPASRLITLGGFAFSVDEVSVPGPATRKARALMAYLIMNRHTDIARERLLDIFWPEADPERARDSLNTALWSIRRCLRTAGLQPDEVLPANKSIVRWSADTTVDAEQFAQLAARDDSAANHDALQLYRGDFLEGDYDNWAVAERERLAALYESVLARVIRTSKDVDAAQRFIARNPYDEEAYATLIEGELAAGRRASAASLVDRCRKALSEVGEKPSAEFEARFRSIVHVEPLVADELTLPFAGRETELALLAAKLTQTAAGHGNLTLVHGEAGIGKSTLLNRAAHIASENGLRVLVIRCASDVPSMFGPWPSIFKTLAGADFGEFARAHAGDLPTATAQAISNGLSDPTAIIVDDAHELTGEALDIFVAFSQTAAAKHSVLAGLRPEGVSRLRSRLSDVAFEEMPISRLDRDNLKWALEQALGSEQLDVLNILYDRTGGHPLFFTGLLNSLVTTGVLARDRHQWRLTKPISADIELPDTVKRFIETRLRARGDTPRTVACALALEPAASADDLTAVLHLEETTVLDALDDLLALGLIAQPLSGTQFAFTHDLIREVAASELNVGRRTLLHRSFAERLRVSNERESSLRLAHHAQGAGDSLLAAQSYLRSAEEAFELNAPQDAIDRCDAGIAAADMLERTQARDVLLARLHRTAANAAIAVGSSGMAIKRARDAVRLARASGDLRELTHATLTVAVIEGIALQIPEQKSEAAEAVQNAKLCGDDAFEAEALVQQASAARELGLRDEALRLCRSAHTMACEHGRTDIAEIALEELLRTQITWWLFADALQTARTGLDTARRAEPLVEAAFLQLRCGLWYLLDRFGEAQSDLQAAIQIASAPIARSRESSTVSIHPLPFLRFACHYMTGKILLTQKNWDRAIHAAQEAASITNVAKLPRHREALLLLHIDALLQRNLRGDSEAAHDLIASFSESTFTQGTVAWSDCIELARARDAARQHAADAGALLRRALNRLEENSHRAPLEADRAFARLTEAASEVGEAAVAHQAQGRFKYYRSRRLAAAGSAWGGEVHA